MANVKNMEGIIESYEKEYCLWDVTSAEYKDRNLKQAVLLRLKEEFGMSSGKNELTIIKISLL